MIGPKKQIGVVISKLVLAEKMYEIDIEISEPMIFKAGQYVSLKVSEKGERRSYSVVSYKNGLLKLLVDTGPGGVGSVFVESLVVGQQIEVMGFFGNFLVTDNNYADRERIYFVATGTGIAPYLPMIEKLLDSGFKGDVILWWGVRFIKRLYWTEKIKEISNKWNNFKYEIYISKPEGQWGGRVGRVGDDLETAITEMSAWYLCGSTDMIELMKEKLFKRGVLEDNINYEKFF